MVGDRDEVAAGALGAELLHEACVHELEDRVGLDRRAGLRRHEEEAAFEVEPGELGFDRAGYGRVEDAKGARLAAVGHRPPSKVRPRTSGQRLEPPIPITTAVSAGCCRTASRKRGAPDRLFLARGRQVEPAHPARLVRIGEDRGLLAPERVGPAVLRPGFRGGVDVALGGPECVARRREAIAEQLLTLGLDREEQAVEGIAEEGAALREQAVGDLLERDAEGVELGEDRLCLGLQRRGVLPERIAYGALRRNASRVASGRVLTVWRPISSST